MLRCVKYSLLIILIFFFKTVYSFKTLIYNDVGCCQESLIWTIRFFESIGDTVKIVNANFLSKNKKWIKQYDRLVIPGGADCHYHKRLKGIGCRNIKEFVKNGGTYIGICAGAYFGCRKVEFALGTDIEVNEDRELVFFDGVAIGPMLKPYVYDSEKGASAAKIRVLKSGNVFYVYHNGGCSFIVDKTNKSNTEILAVYANANNAPAIIKCKYGKGHAVLSGVHYEVNCHSLLVTIEESDIVKPIAKKIEITDEFRKNFLKDILQSTD